MVKLLGITMKGWLAIIILSSIIMAISFVAYLIWQNRAMWIERALQSESDKTLIIRASKSDNNIVQRGNKELESIDDFINGDSNEIIISNH
jgi:hypothetical protein